MKFTPARWPWPLLGGLVVAYVAMLGSLYFSEIRGFVPCNLCWYQRILMYPLVPLLAFAIVSRVPSLAYLVLVFAVAGQGVSIYHYLIQKTTWFASASVCGTGVSCGLMYIDWFGVFTIPMLAMIAFMLISLMMVTFLNGMGDEAGQSVFLYTRDGSALVVAVILLLGAAVWLLARGGPDEPDQTHLATGAAVSVSGRSLFQAQCAVCHGPEGEGIPTLTPALRESEKVRTMTEEELMALVRAGIAPDSPSNQTGNPMPPFAESALADGELQAIIHLLQSWTDE